MISLITPSYNSAAYIEETWQSICRQTYTDWEWLIVDDGSTDNTLDLLKTYSEADHRVRFFVRDRSPKGATTCRNIAIDKSRGEYLLFLDTDDILASFCLKQRVNALMANPGFDFIVFQMLIFHKEPADTRLLWNVDDGRDDLERAIRLNPVMAGSSTIWKKASFVKIGLWDERILINQDIELHIRALAYGLKYLLKLDLPPDLFVRHNTQSISRATKKSVEKQLSRVYFFGRIREHLQKAGVEEKYRSALQWLFMKLLFELLHDRETAVAKQLYNENSGFVERLPLKYKIACQILLAGGVQSYRLIEGLRMITRSSISKAQRTHTFGKHFYQGRIVY